MRILLVHRHFWPDHSPQATILRSIGKRLVEAGHDVEVFTAQPGYGNRLDLQRRPWSELLDGLRVRRTRLLPESRTHYVARALNYGLFFVMAAMRVLRGRYDVVMGLTAPPVLPGAVLGSAARLARAHYVYHCLDIYPEIARATGMIASEFGYRVLRRIDARSIRMASAAVVISADMRQSLVARGADPSKVHIIPEFDLEEFTADKELPHALRPDPAAVSVLFAGNLGRFQALDTVVDAAQLIGPDAGIRFHFLGSGVVEDPLRTRAGDLLGRSVHFHGYVDPVVARKMAEVADICLVTLAPDIIRYAFPAKVVTYLRAGATIAAMVEKDSELAQLIAAHKLGAVVEPGDARGLADAITELAGSDRAAIAVRARQAFRERFDRDAALALWVALFTALDGERSAR